jgi:ATP-dependent Clp protease protease subunit
MFLYDEIGPAWMGLVSAEQVVAELNSLGEPDEIKVHINSPGGDVFEGLTIYNALARHPARVAVEVDGLAASIASVIAMAGDSVQMSPGSMFMMHEAWTLSLGNKHVHKAQYDVLDKIDENLVGIYSDRSRVDTTTIRELMMGETWMTADEAIAHGFADGVPETPLSVAACSIPRHLGFRHVPAGLTTVEDDPIQVRWDAAAKKCENRTKVVPSQPNLDAVKDRRNALRVTV